MTDGGLDPLRAGLEEWIGKSLSASGPAVAPDEVNLPMIRHWVDAFGDRHPVCLGEAYARFKGDQLYLVNANIPEYSHGNRLNHEPRRPRKLLLHAREIGKLFGAVERKGMTLVPLSVYFNKTGRAKVELALAKGKQAHDKRASVKERDWKRDKARIMRDRA